MLASSALYRPVQDSAAVCCPPRDKRRTWRASPRYCAPTGAVGARKGTTSRRQAGGKGHDFSRAAKLKPRMNQIDSALFGTDESVPFRDGQQVAQVPLAGPASFPRRPKPPQAPSSSRYGRRTQRPVTVEQPQSRKAGLRYKKRRLARTPPC